MDFSNAQFAENVQNGFRLSPSRSFCLTRAVMLLASGGIDSSALMHFYLSRGVKVQGVHFQYGQRNALSEHTAVMEVSRYYGVETRLINFGFTPHLRKDEVLCRNALFVLVAASLGLPLSRIAVGIHTGPPYYDCSESFLHDCQRTLNGYFAGTVRVEAPFIELSKTDIYEYCKKQGVPMSLTYSCQRQSHPPCGKCPSCSDREKFYGR